jgi:hypothetical protein
MKTTSSITLSGGMPFWFMLFCQKHCAFLLRDITQGPCFERPSGVFLTSVTDLSDSHAAKREKFVQLLLPKHPPVFDEWFRFTFPEPYAW